MNLIEVMERFPNQENCERLFCMNKLYFGDNLEIMREMEPAHVDLICTDPPFNSGRDYNAFFQESKAQEKAFTDIWHWDTDAIEARQDIWERADTDDTYKALDMCLKGYDFVLQNAVKGNKGSMRAYLAFMGPRLAEMHRLLRDTGSIYLHCDQAASHYLKGVMDAIWDQKNLKNNVFFQNDIIWGYRTGGVSKKRWAKKHQNLLFYAKSKDYKHNPLSERIYYDKPFFTTEKDEEGNYYADVYVRDIWEDILPLIKTSDLEKDVFLKDVWQDIKPVLNVSSECLHYNTQKPRTLYERLIQASSDQGMLVMDPFCGCGTTIDAAHTLKRNWIGIDLTIIALDPISKRMRDRHTNSANKPLEPHEDYEIIGYPTNMQEVEKLVRDENKRNDFANWAVTRLGMIPTEDRDDGGKDGIGQVMLWDPKTEYKTDKRIISEVKTGNLTLEQVRAFCHTMNEQNAVAGIFITLEPATKGMYQIAANMGNFELENNRYYPRLQFWRITDEYFDNPSFLRDNIRLPYNWIIPRKKSERHFDNQQLELL